MTSVNLQVDPMEMFANRLPIPGHGDYAADAAKEIERRFGPEVAQDFIQAYRDNDADAANRVANKLSGDMNFKISKLGGEMVGQVFGEKAAEMKGSLAEYRSEAHFTLAFSLKNAAKEQKLADELDADWKPPVPKFAAPIAKYL